MTVDIRYQHPGGGPLISADFRMPWDRHHITVLLGPSGSGKSTILRCVAGLDRPQSGRIQFANECWFDSERRLWIGPQERRIGFLFQDYALFPHLNVVKNIAYGITRSRKSTAAIEGWLDRFAIRDLAERLPHQLSGGEQQRVALARTLAAQPRLLLLDEPLSALDSPLRIALREELRQHLRHAGIPVVLVTHDMAEAEALAHQTIQL